MGKNLLDKTLELHYHLGERPGFGVVCTAPGTGTGTMNISLESIDA